MQFNGFPKEGLSFLDNIILNNSKEWLDTHKEEYEKYILSPNKAYVEEMGEHLQILVPSINAIPKINKSLFRIYRDALQQGSTDDIRVDAAVGLLLQNDEQGRDALLSALQSEENHYSESNLYLLIFYLFLLLNFPNKDYLLLAG